METRRPIQAAFLACRLGSVEKMMDFLRKNPQQIDTKDYDQKGFVEIAIENDHFYLFYAILDMLHELGKLQILFVQFTDGTNAMKVAIKRDDVELVQALIKHKELTLLSYFEGSREGIVCFLAEFGGMNVCSFIMSNNLTWIELPIMTMHDRFPLQIAAMKNNILLANVLLKLGAAVDAFDQGFHNPPILIAVTNKNVEMTRLLLSYGGTLSRRYDKALIDAAVQTTGPSKHVIVELLLKHGVAAPPAIRGCYSSFIERGYCTTVLNWDGRYDNAVDLATLEELDYDLTIMLQISHDWRRWPVDVKLLWEFHYYCENGIETSFIKNCLFRFLSDDYAAAAQSANDLLDVVLATLERLHDHETIVNSTAVSVIANCMNNPHLMLVFDAISPFINDMNTYVQYPKYSRYYQSTATVLHLAIRSYLKLNDIKQCTVLLHLIQNLLDRHEIDVNEQQIISRKAFTPLICALYYATLDNRDCCMLLFPLIQLLIKAGANVNEIEELTDRTALHWFLQKHDYRSWKNKEWSISIVKLFLEAGVDLKIRDCNSKTVADIAKRNNFLSAEMQALLTPSEKRKRK